MDKLSVAIITLNEERNIGRCLESVQAVADEIVVVDSFSTDDTSEICESYGVNFSTHPFEGHIEQKNYALSLCAHKHVLALDADEALSAELKESILNEKQSGFKNAYSMNRLTRYCGRWIRHGGWYPDKKIRLVNKEQASWGGTNPHDKLLTHRTIKPIHLEGDLLHYSINTIDEHIKVVHNFARLGAHALHKKGEKAPVLMEYLSPVYKFIQSYFFQLGLVEGKHGWHIAKYSAKSKYLKYKLLRELNQQAKTS